MTNQATPGDEPNAATGNHNRGWSRMSRRTRITLGLWAVVIVALSALLLAGRLRGTQSNTIQPLPPVTTAIGRSDQQNGRDDERLDDSVGSVTALTIAPEFEPESGELSNCVGSFAERPGCGARGRGGRGQNLVFLVLVGGLAFIGWRIYTGAKKQHRSNQRASHRA